MTLKVPADQLGLRLKALLFRHGKVSADGRPLFKYRFNAAEYERAKDLLRAPGKRVLQTPAGCAMFVMFLSEWFRRDRDGGGWEWKRPLAAINLIYDDEATGIRALRYPELRDALVQGLKWWRRPIPKSSDTGLKYIYAIVRESGFPLAAVRQESGLKRWIEKSVDQMFRGASLDAAVRTESNRVGSPELRRAVWETAAELCQAIFTLKRIVIDAGTTMDPVAHLNAHHPNWLLELPLDAGEDDIRLLIEGLMRAKLSEGGLFQATRILVRSDDGWRSKIHLNLTGVVDDRDIPSELTELLADASRVRIFVRSKVGDASSRPVALMERVQSADGNAWEARSLVELSEFDLPLHEDLSLVFQVGERPPGSLNPAGAQPLHEGATVFGETPGRGTRLRLSALSTGSVRSTADKLFLLIERALLGQVIWSPQSSWTELGEVGQHGLVLVEFTGEATLAEDGLNRVWQTGMETQLQSSLRALGRRLPGVQPDVFDGWPQFLCEENQVVFTCRPGDLRWRPKGHSAWLSVDDTEPMGDLEVAFIKDNQICAVARERMVPAGTRILADKNSARMLRVLGTGARKCGVQIKGTPLTSNDVENGWTFDLETHQPGALCQISLSWGRERLALRARDTSLRRAVLDRDGNVCEARQKASVTTIVGRALWAQATERLFLQATGSEAKFSCVRTASGETPLAVFRDDIRSILSLSDSPDAKVRMEWLGEPNWAIEISRFDEDLRQIDWDLPFEQIRNWLRLKAVTHIVVVPVLRPEGAVKVEIDQIDAYDVFSDVLVALAGAGPWIVTANCEDFSTARPFFFPAHDRGGPRSRLDGALLLSQSVSRRDALVRLADDQDGMDGVASYISRTAQVCRRYNLPPTSFDALNALAGSSKLAVGALAQADTIDDLHALLELELDLPFLWASTPVSRWEQTFRERLEQLKSTLEKVGVIDPAVAANIVLGSLAKIATISPILAMHANSTALKIGQSLSPQERDGVVETVSPLLDDLHKLQSGDTLDLAQAMVRRRIDGSAAPPKLSLPTDIRARGIEGKFDPQFDDVLRAPYLAARVAIGALAPSLDYVLACRRARLFDPRYFDETVPLAIYQLSTSKHGVTPS
jgi:hypothetical protein